MFRPFTSRELRPIVVAIPVRDEEERIGQCLAALSQQNEFQADHVVLLVNNTIDDSIAIARQRPMPAGTCLHIIKRILAAHQASAGYARRLAMQQAVVIAGPDGILLTTDADGRVDPDPYDPMSRHTQNSAASIAVTAWATESHCGRRPFRANELCGGIMCRSAAIAATI